MSRHKYDQLIGNMRAKDMSLTTRTLALGGSRVWVVYVKQLVDTQSLSQFVISPLIRHYENELNYPTAQRVASSIISAADCMVESDTSKVEVHILNGMVVLLFGNDNEYLVVNLKQVPHRTIDTPSITYSMLGPKDSFVENLDVNLSLIRYRIKDPNLKIDMFELGKRTKTAFAAIYINDIANEETVKRVENAISQIDTDAIWGTGDVANILSGKFSLFKTLRPTERSDMACEALMEGKILLLGDGGTVGMITPFTYVETLISCDDRYDNQFFGFFARLVRYAALLTTLCATAVYVAIVSFHTDAVPGSYAILLTKLRQSVLFPAMIEVLIVEFIVELIRESLIRVPSKIGTAIGIVGAIIIGSAATAAGIFDDLVLILVSASLLASFAMPDYASMHPIRILKFFLIIMTGILGFYGFVLGLSAILTNLVSMDSFGVPYFAPFAPYNKYDFKRSFLFSRQTSGLRMRFMRTNDDTRSSKGHVVKKKLNKNK
ncbi:MAG TPA: spore germination protein [Clostridia bacterium]|nr:spore germination protein [Clostridia bacterium]